jgi:hypothetical protein
MLEATTDTGERNTWATRFRVARENKLVYLDKFFSDLDLSAMSSALTIAVMSPGASNEPKHIACSKLSAGFTALRMLYEKPQKVKQRAPEIKALLIEGYAELQALS